MLAQLCDIDTVEEGGKPLVFQHPVIPAFGHARGYPTAIFHVDRLFHSGFVRPSPTGFVPASFGLAGFGPGYFQPDNGALIDKSEPTPICLLYTSPSPRDRG